MKNNLFARTAVIIGIVIALFTAPNTAIASTKNTYEIARTKAWDAIPFTLGGIPESVIKVEYAGSIFYLGTDITEKEFLAVIELGAQALELKPPKAANTDKMYYYPVYILWNADKTTLLVHPIIFDYDNVLEAVAISAKYPSSHIKTKIEKEKSATLTETQKYMLSAEYADAVRNEFYRLLNEYRAANGLRKLEVSLELQEYADIRAEELRIKFSHTRPNGTPAGSGWHNMWNVMGSRYAENAVGVGSVSTDPLKTANSIFTSWKNSEGHNKHLLYNFDSQVKMALGFTPKLDENGFITSGAIFASGY